MLKAFAGACVIAGGLIAFPAQSNAQEMIHALTGTVSSIDTANKMITVLQDNGKTGDFQLMSNPKTRISFDKKVQADSSEEPVKTRAHWLALATLCHTVLNSAEFLYVD